MTTEPQSPAFNAEPEVKSPCVSLCVLSEQQVCLGCGRSRDEVAAWSRASVDEQRQVCERAKARMESLF